MDVEECTKNTGRGITRAQGLRDAMPEQDHLFPLGDKELSKPDAHGILAKAGIRRPRMYDLGFPNNNCRVCVKRGKGYMNLCRRIFPAEFADRAKTERECGASCINGTFLDELDPEAGRDCEPILPECGAMCEMMEEPKAECHGRKKGR